MEARWDIAAVMVALLAILLSPAVYSAIHQSLRHIAMYIWPSKSRCIRLFWSDIPNGYIHICNATCQHVNQHGVETHEPMNCWESSLGRIFTQAWILLRSDPSKTVSKPFDLDLLRDYVKIDGQTLRAFLLLAVTIREHGDVNSRRLKVRVYGSKVSLHLTAPVSTPANTAVTKYEIERIIDGYPPFYQRVFTTTAGVKLEHPIRNTKDVSRGGWVFAVGLTITNGTIPVMHNMASTTHQAFDAPWKATQVMDAFRMIGHTLSQIYDLEKSSNTEQHWHYGSDDFCKETWSDHALSCYEMIMASEYSLQPWEIKTARLEESLLLEPIFGKCPCMHTCLGNARHAE